MAIMTTHVLIGGTNAGRHVAFHGVSVQLEKLGRVEAYQMLNPSETTGPIIFETYRLEAIECGGGGSVVICLHESLNIRDGLMALLNGYKPEVEG